MDRFHALLELFQIKNSTDGLIFGVIPDPFVEYLEEIGKNFQRAAMVSKGETKVAGHVKLLTVHWSNGAKSSILGTSLGDALKRAGYRESDIYLIDFVSNGDDNAWTWLSGYWVRKAEENAKLDYAKQKRAE
jgi:hypothetical protein